MQLVAVSLFLVFQRIGKVHVDDRRDDPWAAVAEEWFEGPLAQRGPRRRMKRLRTAEDGYGGYTSVDVNGHIGNHESADLRRGRRGRPHGVDLFHDLRESGL